MSHLSDHGGGLVPVQPLVAVCQPQAPGAEVLQHEVGVAGGGAGARVEPREHPRQHRGARVPALAADQVRQDGGVEGELEAVHLVGGHQPRRVPVLVRRLDEQLLGPG